VDPLMNKQILNYDGDFSKIVPIHVLEKQVFINALSITKSIKHAAKEAGVTARTLQRFMSDYDITDDDLRVLRRQFELSNRKVKLRYHDKNMGISDK
jgi:hypothetical protein